MRCGQQSQLNETHNQEHLPNNAIVMIRQHFLTAIFYSWLLWCCVSEESISSTGFTSIQDDPTVDVKTRLSYTYKPYMYDVEARNSSIVSSTKTTTTMFPLYPQLDRLSKMNHRFASSIKRDPTRRTFGYNLNRTSSRFSSSTPFDDSVAEFLTECGKLMGTIRKNSNNYYYTEVLGVPYAEPPIGTLRFRRPQPRRCWPKGTTLKTTSVPPTCPQAIDGTFNAFPGVEMWNPPKGWISEDCLYLNIWTPDACFDTRSKRAASKKCAVMVWIYGGGYYGGSATLDLYNGTTMATEGNIVFVSINYRVGPFGFLYTGTEDAPGNQGLLDQQMALKWVRNNIAQFGGDRDRVTIFGESAGAASVSFHLFAKGSLPLFNSAIMQSSVVVQAPWTIVTQKKAKKRAAALAELFGCDYKKVADSVRCLRDVSLTEIANQQFRIASGRHLEAPCAPVVDGLFIERDPNEMIRTSPMPKKNILLGANNDEGSYFVIYGFQQYEQFNKLNHRPRDLNEMETRNIFKRIVEDDFNLTFETAYFLYKYAQPSPKPTPKSIDAQPQLNIKIVNDVLGDRDFLCPVVNFAEQWSNLGNQVFLYYFNHRSSTNPWPQWAGVMHGYEIEFIMGLPLRSNYSRLLKSSVYDKNPKKRGKYDVLRYSSEEVALSEQMLAAWTNFAKTGHPSKKDDSTVLRNSWPTHDSVDRSYVIFGGGGRDQQKMGQYQIGQGLRHTHCSFWSQLEPKIRRADKTICLASSVSTSLLLLTLAAAVTMATIWLT